MGQVLKIDTLTAGLPLALELDPALPFDDWVSIGRRLKEGQQAINWHIGDWWRFGAEHYGQASAKQIAADIWGVEGETARVYGWVAEKFAPVTRVTDLSFRHYQEAASLPADQAGSIIETAARDKLSTRDVSRLVQAIKAANDPEIGAVTAEPVERTPPPEFTRGDLVEAYSRYAEVVDCLSQFRALTPREDDYLAKARDFLGETHALRKPPPDDFKIVFVEKGRVQCETWYGVSRITVTRWLRAVGMRKLIDERAAYVKCQRNIAAGQPAPAGQPQQLAIDTYLPVARMAADYLRQSKNGGWMISQREAGGWLMGTVYHTSEELIARAERQGFDRQAAVTEARQEGY